MSKTALLHGGGLDSTAVFLHLIDSGIDFDCVWCDYGQVAADAEIAHIRAQCVKYGVNLSVSQTDTIRKLNKDSSCMIFSGDHNHTPIVEGRNMALIMNAVLKGYDKIYVGIDKPASGDAWGDASKEFIQTMNDLFSMSFNHRKIEVIAPFIKIDKEDVFKKALGFDKDFFAMSMTCWTPESVARMCGKCKHCKLEVEYKQKLNIGDSHE